MKVKGVCELINGRAFKPSDWETEGIPIIRIQNLNDENAPFNYYAGQYDPVHEVNDGELLFSWSGTPGTSFGAFRWYRGKGVLNQHIFRVVPIIPIDKDYLMYALNGNLHTIISKAHGGVGLQHITKKELDEIDIPVPEINIQRDIVAIISRTKEMVAIRQRQLRTLDTLIKARFVEMFGDPVSNPKQWKMIELGQLTSVGSSKRIFEKEYVAYRFVDKRIVAITDTIELETIESGCNNPYEQCREHFKKGVGFLADRENKDYKNCVKESISAVESMCRIIDGNDRATLTTALSRLEKSGISIDKELKEAFSLLYKYTCDKGGIRHAERNTISDVTFEEAKFMLVSCSAFVNYLIAVSGKGSN